MPEKFTKLYSAKRIHPDGSSEPADILLAKECTVKLFIDGKAFTTLFASPFELKELAVGHLITEGVLNYDEIAKVEEQEAEINILTVNILPGKNSKAFPAQKVRPTVSENLETIFNASAIFAGIKYLESDTYKLTRGTHLAALVDGNGKLAVKAVDVGRHNAMDKAIGRALLCNLDLKTLYLLSTGRQPGYMVTKAARVGIPLIATKAMPFDSGVEAAKKAKITLVGRLREESMLVFTNEWRIISNEFPVN